MSAIELAFIFCISTIIILGVTLAVVDSRARGKIERLEGDVGIHKREALIYKMSHDLVMQRAKRANSLIAAHQDAFDALRQHDLPVIIADPKTRKLIDDSLSARLAGAIREASEQ